MKEERCDVVISWISISYAAAVVPVADEHCQL
jgi:hypothetical protein